MRLWLMQTGSQVRDASKHSSHWLHWLVSLGAAGLFAAAVADSSMIPLPIPGSTDLLLLVLTVRRAAPGVWLIAYPAVAVAGSLVGGYLTWSAGWKGGDATLERYVPRRYLGRIRGWVEKHGVWSVALSAILPPPFPMTPFVLAAGALKLPRARFLWVFGVVRAVRYGLLTWLGVSFGRHFVIEWRRELERWSSTILWTYGAVMVLGIGYMVWKMRRGGGERKRTARAEGV